MATVIWTNHALQRLSDRKTDKDFVLQAFYNPDKRNPGKQSGTTDFIKQVGKYKITLIASQNEKYEWIIISAWVEPPFSGSIDILSKKKYLEYNQSSGWKKVWLIIKEQFGF